MVVALPGTLPLKKAVRRAVYEFSENTSIHGVRYIAENGRRWVERFIWIITEVVCIASAVYLLTSTLLRFRDNPTLTRIDSHYYSAATVPFPAITFCNVNNIFHSKARRLVDKLVVPDALALSKEDVREMLPILGQLLSMSYAEQTSDARARYKLDRLLGHNNLTSLQTLEQLGQPCDEMIERCSFEGREVNCTGIFKKSLTYLGFCCSFNSELSGFTQPKSFASPSSPSSSEPVKRAESSGFVPLTTDFFGYPMGLTVLLNPKRHDYFWGTFASAGFVCMVHDSTELASELSPKVMVAGEREMLVQVVPLVRRAAPSVRTVAPRRRRCLFDDEYPLASSSTYSYDSCLIECRAAMIWKSCACRPIFFPRISGPRAKPCTLLKISCLIKFYEEERDEMVRSLSREEVPADPGLAEALSEVKFQACGCLAQCDSIAYDLETSSAALGNSKLIAESFFGNINATGRTLMHMYFDRQTASLYVNELVSDPVQLMSSLGGIFSLFLGCSFMSGVELLYFFTVRLWLLFRGDSGLALPHSEEGTPMPPGDRTTLDNVVSKSLSRHAIDEGWSLGWGSDKPIRPRKF